mmetsp:Transcript_18084/g.30862  ORF Transcript_18084/g.30862 Transcript_18084/m.30862 type:complete len:246 (+) Transcript_18084:1284-2021(+)
MKRESLTTFKDVPEKIDAVFLTKLGDTFAEIEWDEPEANNSKILSYTVYLSDQRILNLHSHNAGTSTRTFENQGKHKFVKHGEAQAPTTSFRLTGLTPSCAYHVKVTASSEMGEGYFTKRALMVITHQSLLPKSLYVWGDNSYSEIGLNEQLVEENKADYRLTQKKAYLSKPVSLPQFSKIVQQVGSSSQSTLVLCYDDYESENMLIQMGLTAVLTDNSSLTDDDNCIRKEQLEGNVENIASMPF